MKTVCLAIVAMIFMTVSTQAQNHFKIKKNHEREYTETIHDSNGQRIGYREISSDGKVINHYDREGRRTERHQSDDRIPDKMIIYDYSDDPVGYTQKAPGRSDLIYRYNMDGRLVGSYIKDRDGDWDYHPEAVATSY